MRGVLALSALVACDGSVLGGDDDDDTGSDTVPAGPGLESSTETRNSNAEGRSKIEIEVPPGVTAFQVTGVTEDRLYVQELIAPDGTTALDPSDWLGRDQSLTQAIYIDRPVMAFNWPIRAEDGPLEPGTWTLWLGHTDRFGQALANEPFDLTVTLKRDPDPETAVIGVQIVYAEGVDTDPDVVSAIEEAVERWRTIWANQGITLAEHYETSNLDPDTAYFFEGDPKIANVAARKAPGELQLVIGEEVLGDSYILGISAGIPGTVEVTEHTFVALSWLSHIGPDGEFSAADIRVMGETMAHEIGHYVGLFHPVEFSFSDWDALGDTDECTRASECEETLGRNLMFPYPLCNFSECEPQGQLSVDQQAVLHQQVSAL